MATTISNDDVSKVASLANLSLTSDQIERFTSQFSATIDVVNQLNEIDTSKLTPTSQVTSLENVTRPDVVDTSRIFSQKEALSQAKHTHNGYFVVPQLIDKNE